MLYPGGADEHPGDVCYALVCRVTLGYTIRTKGRHPSIKGQCTAMDPGTSSTNMVFATNACRELVKLPGMHAHT